MKNKQKQFKSVLAIDLGHTYGFCFKDSVAENSGENKWKELTEWGVQLTELIRLYKPDILVLSQTNNFGFWNAARSALMQAGVAFYLAGKKGIAGIEINDSSCRKIVLGKAIKKKEVQAMFPQYLPNELDAVIIARASWLQFN